MQRITRLVFWLDGIFDSHHFEPENKYQMGELLDVLQDHYQLWLVSSFSPKKATEIFSRNALSEWFDQNNIYLLPGEVADHREMLQSLVAAGVIYPGKSLWIDHHPIRTMIAIRQGIDASIFVNGARLHRDLELWGIIPLDN